MVIMALNNNGFPLWECIIAGLLAITGIGFLVRKHIARKALNKKGKCASHQSATNTDRQEQITDETNKLQQKPIQGLELPEGFIELLELKVDNFAGNFSALQNIANDNEVDTNFAKMVFQNVANVFDIQYDNIIKTWFSSFANDRKTWDAELYKNKAALLIKLFTNCGVIKSDETELEWNNKAGRRYNRIEEIKEGVKCQVIAPYWTLNGIVIEKGMVKAK